MGIVTIEMQGGNRTIDNEVKTAAVHQASAIVPGRGRLAQTCAILDVRQQVMDLSLLELHKRAPGSTHSEPFDLGVLHASAMVQTGKCYG